MNKVRVTIDITPKLAFILDRLSVSDNYEIEATLWRMLDAYREELERSGYCGDIKEDLEGAATTWLG